MKEISNGRELRSEFKEGKEKYKLFLINIQEGGDMSMTQFMFQKKVSKSIENIQSKLEYLTNKATKQELQLFITLRMGELFFLNKFFLMIKFSMIISSIPMDTLEDLVWFKVDHSMKQTVT